MDSSSLPTDFCRFDAEGKDRCRIFGLFVHSFGHALPIMESACCLPNDRSVFIQ